jgi:hypothetical protein
MDWTYESMVDRFNKALGNASDEWNNQMGGITGSDYLKKKGPPLPPNKNIIPKMRTMGQAGLMAAALEGGTQLGKATGLSKIGEEWGSRLRGDRPPADYNPATGEMVPRYQFKGLPANTLAQIKASKAAKPKKMYSGEEVDKLVDDSINKFRASQSPGVSSGGSGNDSWDKRMDLLMGKLGLKTDENTPFIIRGSTMTPQYPMGSVANQIGPENAAKMLMSIMTGTSHEIPATMHGSAALGTLGLENQLMPGRLKTQGIQNKILETEEKSTHLADESPFLTKSSSIRSTATPTSFNDSRFRRADKETREQHLRRLLDEGY